MAISLRPSLENVLPDFHVTQFETSFRPWRLFPEGGRIGEKFGSSDGCVRLGQRQFDPEGAAYALGGFIADMPPHPFG